MLGSKINYRSRTHYDAHVRIYLLSLCHQPKPFLPLCSECVSCPKSAFFFFSQKPRKKDFYTLQDNSNAVCWSLTTIMITLLCIFLCWDKLRNAGSCMIQQLLISFRSYKSLQDIRFTNSKYHNTTFYLITNIHINKLLNQNVDVTCYFIQGCEG